MLKVYWPLAKNTTEALSNFEKIQVALEQNTLLDNRFLNMSDCLSKTKPLEWKRYIDDIFSLWRTDRKEIDEFIALANSRHYPSIKFTVEISEKEINFLGEALRLLRTNSSAKSFYENIYNFKKRLRTRGYPHNLIEKITSEVKFAERKSALQKNNEVRKKILPFVTTYHPALPNLKNILMSKWHLIQDHFP